MSSIKNRRSTNYYKTDTVFRNDDNMSVFVLFMLYTRQKRRTRYSEETKNDMSLHKNIVFLSGSLKNNEIIQQQGN